MSLHILTAWEDNGYHDSYFNESWWNTETAAVEFHEVSATAHAGYNATPRAPISDPAVLEQAMAWLAEYIFGQIKAAELRDVLTPDVANCQHGREFRLLRNCRNKGRVVPAGTVGELISHASFGTFYAKGYNRPDRSNTRVTLRLADGSFATVALAALRQHREPMTDDELCERAAELSRDCQFSKASGWKCAWDSKNYAADLLKRTETAKAKAA